MTDEVYTENGDGAKPKKVGTEIIKCDGCGANMIFDPDAQKLYCPHCGSVKELKDGGTAKEISLLHGLDSDNYDSSDEAVVFRCSNCGASVVINDGKSATVCPFCGTAHVQKTDDLPGLKPNGLIPFAFGAKKALELSKAWAKKRLFAPRKFKKKLGAENVNGVYTPCFTFDSYTTSLYNGKIGITHTRTVGSGKNRRTETWTEWKYISGTYYDNFDDILVTAGSKFDQKKLDKIAPYDTNDGKAYEKKYMLGFMAYKYDNNLEGCWDFAKSRIDARIRNGILSRYVYDKVAYLNVSTSHDRVTYKYVMLPVYVGNYNFNKKLYNFYVNGDTGKVWGKTPKSPLKIAIAVLLGIALVAGVVALYYFYNGGW